MKKLFGKGFSMELQVGVKVLLKNKQGKFLLLKRSLKKYPNIIGNWDIVGGRINPGISLIENLKREVQEEIGLELQDRPKLIAAQDIIKEGKHVVRLTFKAMISGNPKLDKEENTEYKWLTLNQLKEFNDLDYYFKQIVNDIKS